MNLLLLDPSALTGQHEAIVRGHGAKHLKTVLRIEPGDTVRIGRLNGPRGIGTVEAIGENSVTLRCVFEDTLPARPQIDLLLALPRPKVMKRLWAQAAALGVGRILLTNAARVERSYFDTHVIDPAFYTPLLIEGLQQARDTRVPEVSLHRRFKPLIEDELETLSDASLRLVAHPAAAQSAKSVLRDGTTERLLLAIGPEGGWVPFELELLAAHGFRAIHIGTRTLRSDTACIAALAAIHQFIAI